MHISVKEKLNELETIKILSQKYPDLEITQNRIVSKSCANLCNNFKITYLGCTRSHYLDLWFLDSEHQKHIHVFKEWEFSFNKRTDCINNIVDRLEKLNVSESIILQIIKDLYKSCQ